MESKVADMLGCNYKPIAFIKTDEKPEGAIGPKSNKGFQCVMPFINKTITGRVASVFEKETLSCPGAIVGLGFGHGYADGPLGIKFFNSFLSTGLRDAEEKEKYEMVANNNPESVRGKYIGGVRLFNTLDLAKDYLENRIPIYENDEKYVVLKPLEDVEEDEKVENVIFTLNALELSTMIGFDSSIRSEISHIVTPAAAACQAIGNYAMKEAESDDPHAVLGLMDLMGRSEVREPIRSEYFTYAVSWDLFKEYEEKSEYSILDGFLWEKMKDKN